MVHVTSVTSVYLKPKGTYPAKGKIIHFTSQETTLFQFSLSATAIFRPIKPSSLPVAVYGPWSDESLFKKLMRNEIDGELIH